MSNLNQISMRWLEVSGRRAFYTDPR